MAHRAHKNAGPPISPAQIKKIHTLKTALRMDDNSYRVALFNACGFETSKAMSMKDAAELIDDWQTKATAAGVWKPRQPKAKKFDDLDNRRGAVAMATPPQMRMIETVWQEVSRATEPEARATGLRHFIKRIAKVDSLRFLDRDGASAVINALTKMQKQSKSQSE